MVILMCILFICGCALNKKETKEEVKDIISDDEVKEVEEDKYIDDNPIKLGLFEGNGKYKDKEVIKDVYYAPFESNVDIGSFEVFLTDNEKVTGSLGPIMVRKEYVGNGLQTAMLGVLNNYVKSIGKDHMFTKAHSDNIYSIRNILKDGYKVVDEYENERGPMTAFVK